MDPQKLKTRMGDLALGAAMGAAARDYQKELLALHQAQQAEQVHETVDFDELMDDPELEKLHSERIASLKKDAEKRQVLMRKGHGEYREVTESEFLGEVTGSEMVVCHFFHNEFIRCKIMDKHLQAMAPRYFDTKFIRVDAEKCPFFIRKLSIKVLPCVILLRSGVAIDRIIGFEELGGKDDFPRSALEFRLLKKGIIVKKEAPPADEKGPRSTRSTVFNDSDSD